MNIRDALRENGKAFRDISIPSPSYAYIDGLYLVWEDGTKVGYEGIIADDWQPYPEEKEIKPENAGELWVSDDYELPFVTVGRGTYEGNLRILYTGDKDWISFAKEKGPEIIHGKNGWTRLYPPVEDEGVERIEICPVMINPNDPHSHKSTYEFELPGGYYDRVDSQDLILEIPKDSK